MLIDLILCRHVCHVILDRLRLHPTWGFDACPTTAIVGVDPAFRTGCKLTSKNIETTDEKRHWWEKHGFSLAVGFFLKRLKGGHVVYNLFILSYIAWDSMICMTFPWHLPQPFVCATFFFHQLWLFGPFVARVPLKASKSCTNMLSPGQIIVMLGLKPVKVNRSHYRILRTFTRKKSMLFLVKILVWHITLTHYLIFHQMDSWSTSTTWVRFPCDPKTPGRFFFGPR